MTALNVNHAAIQTSTTMYQKNIHSAIDYEYLLLKPSTNTKLGRRVKKGSFGGMKMYTLTLVERETCTSDCEHWLDCYGNNMPFGHRFRTDGIHGDALIARLWLELDVLNRKHPEGFLVRLHILGDFFSVKYVNFWSKAIRIYSNLRLYGYSRWWPTTAIGRAIVKLRTKHAAKVWIRFSNKTDDPMSASSEHVATEGIVCPQQLDKTDNCGTCGLCWTVNKPIIFLTH